MKLYQMSKIIQGNVQASEFVAANTINDAIEFVQNDDFEIPGFNPNAIQELGVVYVADNPKAEAKVLKFENDA